MGCSMFRIRKDKVRQLIKYVELELELSKLLASDASRLRLFIYRLKVKYFILLFNN